MAQTFREAMANTASQPEKPVLRPADEAVRESVARESVQRYRRLVSELNHSRDSDIERALLRA
jgi:hypothetical protein